MPGLSFLNKKSWHTTNVKNVERVWLAEKKAEEEQKRLAELQKQLQEERQILELRQLQAAHGQVTKTIDNSLDWMYEGPVSQNQKQQSSEEYLLGKIYNGAADHSKVAAVIPDPKAPAKWLNKVASKNDSFSRAHEDPFIMIKQEENRRREKLVNNPIKMDKIKQKIALELKEKEDKKSAKKAAKREKKEQKKDAKRRKKETQREGPSGGKDGNSSSSDSGSGSESEGHIREDRHSRGHNTTEVKHEHGGSRENKPDRSRSNSPARDTRPSDRHDAQNDKTRSDDRPHDARRGTRRDSRDRGTDRARERQNSRDRSDAAREHRDRGDRDGNRGGRDDWDRDNDDRRRDGGYCDRRTDRDRSRDHDRRGQYDSRRNEEDGRYNRDNRDSDRHTDRNGRDRRDDRNDRSNSRRSNSRQRDYRNHPASSHHNTSHASNARNGPSESRKRDRSPSPAAPAPAADRAVTNRHTAHSDSENSESSQSKPKQRYGLLPNKNRVNSASSSSDHNSSSSSHAASLGPNPALLQKKVDAEKAAELARKNRARADVRGLTDEERQQRILAMQEDAQKNDAVRAVRHDPERKVAEVDENTGNAVFLDSMRKTVYTTGDTDMQSRLDQNKYSRQSAADIDSAEGFLRK